MGVGWPRRTAVRGGKGPAGAVAGGAGATPVCQPLGAGGLMARDGPAQPTISLKNGGHRKSDWDSFCQSWAVHLEIAPSVHARWFRWIGKWTTVNRLRRLSSWTLISVRHE